jgi:hypothetical protein
MIWVLMLRYAETWNDITFLCIFSTVCYSYINFVDSIFFFHIFLIKLMSLYK